MTKERLWQIYLEKNPSFCGEKICLTAAGLRRFFDKTWDTAYFDGEEELPEPGPVNSPHSASINDLLNAFGMK